MLQKHDNARKQEAAVAIQAIGRGLRGRLDFKIYIAKDEDAVVCVQALIRGHLSRLGWRSVDGVVSPPKGHFQKRLRRDGLHALLPRRVERNLQRRRLMRAKRVRKRRQREAHAAKRMHLQKFAEQKQGPGATYDTTDRAVGRRWPGN